MDFSSLIPYCVFGGMHSIEDERGCGWALRVRLWEMLEPVMSREVRLFEGAGGDQEDKRDDVGERKYWEGSGIEEID